MTRYIQFTTMIVAAALICATVMAEETPAPATDQAQVESQLPEGHPPLNQEAGELPQGHPELPAGHPPMQQQRRMLPMGHPPISGKPAEPVVYETTEVQPDWHVAVRHLIVRPMENQLHITEVWAVVNPTDKSYIGAPVEVVAEEAVEANPTTTDTDTAVAEPTEPTEPAEQDTPQAAPVVSRTTLVLPLPAKASHVQPGRGFEPDKVQVLDGKIISSMPLNPGTNELHVNYLLAAEEGVFDLKLDVPAATQHMMLFLPDDGCEVEMTGLKAGDMFKAGDKQFRLFMGNQLEKGTILELKIKAKAAVEESPAMMPGSAAVPPHSDDSQLKLIAGIGAGVLLLTAVIVLAKPSKKQVTTGTAG